MSCALSPSAAAGVRSVQQQRERWERKRRRVGRELVQSEQRYCEQLDLVATYFVEILKAKGTLRQDIRESIFSSIKSIHLVNQTLLAHLEEGNVGLGFEQFCPHLHFYITYVDNFQTAKKVLMMQLKKNKAFRRFKKLQESRPEFHKQQLEDLLPLPLQRIQQYKHFLRDLTENTSPDNPEFQQLSSAVAAVSEVAQRIQDNARSHENHLQLRRVQKLLKGRTTRLLAPGRWYIREGCLKMVPSKGTEAKPKMFFLFSDILVQAKLCSSIHPTNGNKFTCQRVYPLRECTVDKVFGHTKSQGGLISLTFAQAKLLLMSSDQENINDWYRSLCLAIGQLKSKTTVVHRREELLRTPLRIAADGQNGQVASPPAARRKRLQKSSGSSCIIL
uniref:DH domain-containing protein n=1 Tax=Electrophorus electricus TaxID=8005 RepID=A0A4W4GLS6_ELEEL